MMNLRGYICHLSVGRVASKRIDPFVETLLVAPANAACIT